MLVHMPGTSPTHAMPLLHLMYPSLTMHVGEPILARKNLVVKAVELRKTCAVVFMLVKQLVYINILLLYLYISNPNTELCFIKCADDDQDWNNIAAAAYTAVHNFR